MKLVNGAVIAGLDFRMRPVLIAGEKIWKDNGKELHVTCGLNGEHSAGSFHYYGLALDFRTKYFKTAAKKKKVYQELKTELGSSFDVILHDSHIHVEYNL